MSFYRYLTIVIVNIVNILYFEFLFVWHLIHRILSYVIGFFLPFFSLTVFFHLYRLQ